MHNAVELYTLGVALARAKIAALQTQQYPIPIETTFEMHQATPSLTPSDGGVIRENVEDESNKRTFDTADLAPDAVDLSEFGLSMPELENVEY